MSAKNKRRASTRLDESEVLQQEEEQQLTASGKKNAAAAALKEKKSKKATVAAAEAAAVPLQDQFIVMDSSDDGGEEDGGASSDDEDVINFPLDDPDFFNQYVDDEDQDNDEKNKVRLGTTQQQLLDDANESDSSEDEAVLNRVGDIPLEWYKDEDHIGYDVEGRKIRKSERGALERLLETVDDPNAIRTIHDALHDEKKVLSNKDLELIFNLQRNRVPNEAFQNMYEDYPEGMVQFDPLNHPLARGHGPSKKKFVPALHDVKVVAKMVKRMLKQRDERKAKKKEEDEEKEERENAIPAPYLLWDENKDDEPDNRARFRKQHDIPKPKMPPPGTYESYHPPKEYLPSDTARERHARLRAIDRKEHFLPQSFKALRHVPFYNRTLEDRYQRCLDLCVYPRMQRTRLVVDPQKLLPELPNPRDLRPFPERLSFLYKGHTANVRCISVSPDGQFLATGCDDHIVRIFEVLTGRLLKRYDVQGVVEHLAFCPSKTFNVLTAAVGYSLLFIVPLCCATTAINEHSIRYLRAPGMAADDEKASASAQLGVKSGGGAITQTAVDEDETAFEGGRDLHDEQEKEKRAEFIDATQTERRAGIVVKVLLHARAKRLAYHKKGDYLSVLCPKDHVKYRQVVMLQLSRRKVFCPFRKFSEIVTDCAFHPTQPSFFLSTTNTVRCYNLLAHKLQKKYRAQGGITNCIDIHGGGDNFIVGDSTNHVLWFDSDFSTKPYKRMKSHRSVVNEVKFHPVVDAYPLFASGSSDGQVHVFHGMVHDDLTKNALIVPVKILKHHKPVYSIAWHPNLPWLFTSTEDGTVSCWTE